MPLCLVIYSEDEHQEVQFDFFSWCTAFLIIKSRWRGCCGWHIWSINPLQCTWKHPLSLKINKRKRLPSFSCLQEKSKRKKQHGKNQTQEPKKYKLSFENVEEIIKVNFNCIYLKLPHLKCPRTWRKGLSEQNCCWLNSTSTFVCFNSASKHLQMQYVCTNTKTKHYKCNIWRPNILLYFTTLNSSTSKTAKVQFDSNQDCDKPNCNRLYEGHCWKTVFLLDALHEEKWWRVYIYKAVSVDTYVNLEFTSLIPPDHGAVFPQVFE